MDVKEFMLKNSLDAILVTSAVNISYFAGFSGTEAIVLLAGSKDYILVDSRYYEQAKQQTPGFTVLLITPKNCENELATIVRNENVKRIGFEANDLTVASFNRLSRVVKAEYFSVDLGVFRAVKSAAEINKIEQACSITKKAYEYIFSTIKAGMTEKDIALLLQKFILDNGAEAISFATIVASGQRGSLPHGVASDKIIEPNDFVTIDFGCLYQGYRSDFTRTVCVGQAPNKELVAIYHVVLQAQELAIAAIKPGVKACDIDKIARDYISELGYGDYFGHGLGHGIGLENHELPFINSTSQTILQPGHIITIEPGIYLPHLGGIRIEDDILVTEDGHKNLTNLTKKLLLLNN